MKSYRPRINSLVAARLVSARRRFEGWRQSRTNRSLIPEHLWSLAAELARECGVFRTARELRLNYSTLRSRLDPAESRMAGSKLTPAGFVEVVPSSVSCLSECTVEIEHGNGTKIRIHLKSPQAPDLGAIGNAFLRACS